MDWEAFLLSIQLAASTVVVLVPLGVGVARLLAWRRFPGRSMVEALIAVPLVLPPTVLGFYLLQSFGGLSAIGRWYGAVFEGSLVFSFQGLLLASVIFNLPFAVQPIQRAFEGVSQDLREAAWCSGLSAWHTFWRIELPLSWTGIVTALVLIFAHTLGEFGVVLMVGGNIPSETRTIAIAIYDEVQAFNNQAAGVMAAVLLGFSVTAIAFIYFINTRVQRRYER